MVQQIKSSEEFELALNTAAGEGKLVVAKFGASWCEPCKKIAPFYKQYERQFGSMKFLDIDYDEGNNEELADDWNVDKLPMFLVIKEGEEKARLQSSNATKLHELISQHYKDVAQNEIEDAFSGNGDWGI